MILVLGATGFLGKTVCRILDQEGREYRTTSLSNGVDLRDHDSTIELFESVKPSNSKSFGSTTHEATTGPIKGPLPTSSTPPIYFIPSLYNSFSN